MHEIKTKNDNGSGDNWPTHYHINLLCGHLFNFIYVIMILSKNLNEVQTLTVLNKELFALRKRREEGLSLTEDDALYDTLIAMLKTYEKRFGTTDPYQVEQLIR